MEQTQTVQGRIVRWVNMPHDNDFADGNQAAPPLSFACAKPGRPGRLLESRSPPAVSCSVEGLIQKTI